MENKVMDINIEQVYSDISSIIMSAKEKVMHDVNDSVIKMYWDIGRKLCIEVLGGEKASYGRNVVGEISAKLTLEYGKGFEKSSVFKMIKFYQEFPDYQKVATLSQQLTWSHFVELLPIEDELKRDFYAAMCKNEKWSVRTLRERKKSMLYELTLCNFGGANPPDKRGRRALPMYVTYTDLIQIGIFIVALVSLCYKIFREKRK